MIPSHSLLDCLKEAIDKHQTLQDKNYNDMMSKPLQERVAKGHTLANLTINVQFCNGQPNDFCPWISTSEGFIERITISCQENCSRFREGSLVLLSNGEKKFPLSIEKDGINEMILKTGAFDYSTNILPRIGYPKDGWEMNELNVGINHTLLRACYHSICEDSDARARLESLLYGKIVNQYSQVLVPSYNNSSQDKAVSKALGCSQFHLIQGPPGTGKTYTIAKIVTILVSQGKKVLVTSSTHTAINNCLNAISNDVKDKRKIVKLGEKYQAEEILGNDYITRKTRLPYASLPYSDISQAGIVIGATPYSLCYNQEFKQSSKKLLGWAFDYVIIDEAAQMSIPLSLAALMKGSRIILVGDHRQLDPIVPSGTGNWLFAKSVFKHFADLYPSESTMLDISYRLSPSLLRIPSMLSYGGQLKSAVNDNKEFRNFCCDYSIDILSNQSNEILYIHHIFDALGRSPYEAKLISGIVSDLLRNGKSLRDIALITPYRAQVREIKRQLLECKVLIEEQLDSLVIDTIERMQGQEREYVILSLSNSNPAEVEDRLEFFYSANRLNVAITRAKIKTIVLANEKVFQLCNPSDNQSLEAGPIKDGKAAYWKFYQNSTKVYAKNQDDEW